MNLSTTQTALLAFAVTVMMVGLSVFAAKVIQWMWKKWISRD